MPSYNERKKKDKDCQLPFTPYATPQKKRNWQNEEWGKQSPALETYTQSKVERKDENKTTHPARVTPVTPLFVLPSFKLTSTLLPSSSSPHPRDIRLLHHLDHRRLRMEPEKSSSARSGERIKASL